MPGEAAGEPPPEMDDSESKLRAPGYLLLHYRMAIPVAPKPHCSKRTIRVQLIRLRRLEDYPDDRIDSKY